jgi:hypothetical protein
MQKEMLEHLHYLNGKGLYNIEFQEDLIKAKRVIFTGGAMGQTMHLTQHNKEDLGIDQDISISLLKDSSKKILYHGTSLKIAQKIIIDGVIKKSQNDGLENRSINKETIEYNKIFMSDKPFSSRHYGLRKSNQYDDIMIAIDTTKYQVYTFILDHEWVIWGDVNIKDVKFYYFKDNVPMGELTPQEIMGLTIVEECLSENVFLEALCKNNSLNYSSDPFGIYGVFHSQRVILILRNLDGYELLPLAQKKILAWAALYHDIGIKDNGENTLHGAISYRFIFNTKLIDNAKGLNAEELEIMKFIIECHCISDKAAYQAIKVYNIKNVERAKLLYDMFKDAEDLEILGSTDLIDLDMEHVKRLRRPYSFYEIPYARELYTTEDITKLI